MRRSHDGIYAKNSVECPNCGELKLSHHVCQSCGYYNKRLVIKSKEAESDEDSDLMTDNRRKFEEDSSCH